MKTNVVFDILPPIPYLVKFLVLNYGPKCCQLIKLQDSLKCNFSCCILHAQSPQTNMFIIPLQFCKENVKDEVDFLSAYKRQRFVKSDTVSSGVCGQACANRPK